MHWKGTGLNGYFIQICDVLKQTFTVPECIIMGDSLLTTLAIFIIERRRKFENQFHEPEPVSY